MTLCSEGSTSISHLHDIIYYITKIIHCEDYNMWYTKFYLSSAKNYNSLVTGYYHGVKYVFSYVIYSCLFAMYLSILLNLIFGNSCIRLASFCSCHLFHK
jgi:hypothetical protein